MKTERKTIVYQVYCKPEDKSYVGCTVATLSGRRGGHYNNARKGSTQPLHQALLKYERSDFEWSVLEEFDVYEDALDAEIRYIEELGTLQPVGYNTTSGGEYNSRLGVPWNDKQREAFTTKGLRNSDETRRLQSDAKSGSNNPMFGLTGSKNPNYGNTWSPEKRAEHLKFWSPKKRAEHSKLMKEVHRKRKEAKAKKQGGKVCQ